MADDTTPSAASSVRDAADLIFAAEELLTLADVDDLGRVTAAIDRMARAAKALRANHLDDALDHVAARAAFLHTTRPRPVMGSLVLDSRPDADDRDGRRDAAVDALVDAADVDALRDRVRGDLR